MKESAHIEMQWIVTVCRISVGSLCELGRLPHTLRYVRHAPLLTVRCWCVWRLHPKLQKMIASRSLSLSSRVAVAQRPTQRRPAVHGAIKPRMTPRATLRDPHLTPFVTRRSALASTALVAGGSLLIPTDAAQAIVSGFTPSGESPRRRVFPREAAHPPGRTSSVTY